MPVDEHQGQICRRNNSQPIKSRNFESADARELVDFQDSLEMEGVEVVG